MFCIDDYTIYGLTTTAIEAQMDDYIYDKCYNSDVGVLVLLIITRVLGINILVLDTDQLGNYKSHLFEANPTATIRVVMQRRGNHYNAIVTVMNVPSLHHLVPTSPPVVEAHPINTTANVPTD